MKNPRQELRVLEAFDAALEWKAAEREGRLDDLGAQDPELAARVRKLLAAEDAARAALPTSPPVGAEPGEPAEDLPRPERVSVYRLTSLLGEGGMGTVWRGERDDGLFAQAVAVKLMRPGIYSASAAAQFHAERRMLARLRHPNIAQLFDGGADPQGRAYFIMELVEGVPLTDFVRDGRLGLRASVPLLDAICAAVQHAHLGLVVHADIKPSNILIDREGRPKLLDFGIARGLDVVDEEVAGFGLTQAYASPERRAGARPLPADDIYALGAVLHELATGGPPDTAPPPPLGPDIPGEFAAIVAKSCAVQAMDRYDSAAALARDLRRWADGFPVAALPPTRLRAARLLVRRRPWASAAVAAATAGLILAFTVITALYLRAETERREADRRFDQARGMARYMLFDVFDRLRDTPGTLPLRRALADRARSYLDELSSAPRAPAAVRAEAAIGLMQIAGVDGLFTAGELGDRDKAEAALQRAAALLAHPTAEARNDPQWIYAEGRLRLFEGFRLFDQSAGGRAALPLLREAVDKLARAHDLLPSGSEIAADLWQARLVLADALGSEGDYPAEVAMVRDAIAGYDRDPKVLEASETMPLLLARSYKLIGRAQMGGGSPSVAATAFTRAEATLLDEDARNPRRSRTLLELLDVRWDLAASLSAQGRNDEALATADQGLSAARDRLAIEPDHDGLQRMASLLEAQRVRLLIALKRPDEAFAAATKNLEARSKRHAARPADGVAWREYLAALDQAGAAEDAAGAHAAACGHYREARKGYDGYIGSFPASRAFVLVEALALDDRLAGC